MSTRKLLVLDLDETLVHACEKPLARPPCFSVGPYSVYRRPHLADFVSHVLGRFDVGVWTASGSVYAEQVVERIFPADSLKFVWSSRRCSTTRDWTTGGYQTIKKLNKLKRHGWRLESVIAVDDTPAKHGRNYGNLVTVREFLGDEADVELLLLMRYLDTLADTPNVRAIEKRWWRKQVEPGASTGEPGGVASTGSA